MFGILAYASRFAFLLCGSMTILTVLCVIQLVAGQLILQLNVLLTAIYSTSFSSDFLFYRVSSEIHCLDSHRFDVLFS